MTTARPLPGRGKRYNQHSMLRRALTNALLFYPERGQARSPADLGMPFEEVWLRARDGVRTQAWWIPADGDGPVLYGQIEHKKMQKRLM